MTQPPASSPGLLGSDESLDPQPLTTSLSSSTALGILALLVALLSIALSSIWLVVAETEFSPFGAIFYRLSLAVIPLALWQGALWLRGSYSWPQYDRSSFWLLVVTSLCFSVSLVMLGWSLTQTTVANGTLLYNNMPVFTAVLAWIFLRQRLSLPFIGGLAVSMLGIATIGFSDLQVTAGDITGDLAALLASVLAAISLLCFEHLRRSLSAGIVMLWVSVIGASLLVPLVLWRGDSLWPHSPTVWLAVLGMGLISQSVGQGLLTYCLGVFPARVVAVCMLLIPVLAALMAAVWFGEHLPWTNWLGFGIVLAGIYLAVNRSAKLL